MKKSDVFSDIENNDSPETGFARILSNLHYTHFFLMGRYNKILEKYELTNAQSNVLGIIGHFHPEPVSLETAKSRVLEPNSDVSRIVGRLVEKKLLEKMPDKKNRRKISIRLTPRGVKVHKQLLSDKKFMRFTKDISLEEARNFAVVLGKLRNV